MVQLHLESHLSIRDMEGINGNGIAEVEEVVRKEDIKHCISAH